ncbi:MAG: InlB B-repeat-containing protein [Bacillota bacterium]
MGKFRAKMVQKSIRGGLLICLVFILAVASMASLLFTSSETAYATSYYVTEVPFVTTPTQGEATPASASGTTEAEAYTYYDIPLIRESGSDTCWFQVLNSSGQEAADQAQNVEFRAEFDAIDGVADFGDVTFSPTVAPYITYTPSSEVASQTVSFQVVASYDGVDATIQWGSHNAIFTIAVGEVPAEGSSDATLSVLSYTVANGEEIAIENFDSETYSYKVWLPYGTEKNAIITLSGTCNDSNATISENNTAIADYYGDEASIKVLAENSATTKTYSVDFEIESPDASKFAYFDGDYYYSNPEEVYVLNNDDNKIIFGVCHGFGGDSEGKEYAVSVTFNNDSSTAYSFIGSYDGALYDLKYIDNTITSVKLEFYDTETIAGAEPIETWDIAINWVDYAYEVEVGNIITQYTTFDKALEAVNSSGGTLTLYADVTGYGYEFTGTNAIVFDLNGHTIDGGLSSLTSNGYVIKVNSGVDLTITDSGSTGTITGGNNDGYGGGIYNDGTLTMSGGSISGNNATNGGGIYNAGTLTLENVTISGNIASSGGGVYSGIESILNMYDSIITYNTAKASGGGVYACGDAEFTMYSGEISHNTASSYGGGVYLNGKFTLKSGEISYNEAYDGGGVYISESTYTAGEGYQYHGSFIMEGGSITDNSVSSCGGGVFVGALTMDSNDADIIDPPNTFVMSGGNISNNKALSGYGGGVYINEEDTFNFSGGEISSNQAYYAGGVISFGTFKMSGTAKISNNTALMAGGIYFTNTFTMTGGEITGNQATSADGGGGGVYACGTFIMSGGLISNNQTIGCGGGVYLYGTMEFSGGEICDNTAVYGAGVYLVYSTMDMSGGKIYENVASGDGGGIEIDHATLNMTAGEIYNNIASGVGGGVDVYESIMNMTGGSIYSNTAGTGGGINYYTGTLTVGSTANVTGNVIGGTITDGALSGGTANNIYLSSGLTIAFDAENAFSGTIGVTMASATANISTTWDTACEGSISSDNSGYRVNVSQDGTTLTLVSISNVTFDSNGGSTVSTGVVDTNSTVTEPIAPTYNGYTFDGWYTSGSATAFDFDTAITDDITLTAEWTLNSYTITYVAVDSITTNSNVATYTIEDETITLADATVTGAGFLGWYDADGDQVTSIAAGSFGDITLYAYYSVTAPTADSTTYTYTGNQQTYGISSTDLYTVSGNKQTNADTYTVTVTLVDNCYWSDGSVTALSYTFTIAKADTVIDTTDVAISYTYSGKLQTIDSGAEINHNESSIVYSDNTFTAVGTGSYTVTITVADSDNYNGASTTVDVTVAKATYADITHAEVSTTYTTTLTLADVDLSDNYSWETGNTSLTAGTASYSAVYNADSSNYENFALTISVVVAKADTVIDTTDVVTSYTYSGILQTIDSGATINHSESSIVYSDNTFTAVGTGSYTITISVDESDNYNGASVTVEITVAKATVTAPTADTATFTYSGNEQIYTLAESDLYTISENATQTDADEYTVTVTLKDEDNYEWAEGAVTSFTFTIAKADTVITTTDVELNYTYTGVEQVVESGATINHSESSIAYSDNKFTDVNTGSYTITISVAESANYKAASTTVAISVAKADTVITTTDVETSYTYNGSEQTIESGATINHSESSIVYRDNTFTDVNTGSYTVTISVVESANYNGASVEVTISVAKANLSVAADSISSLKSDEELTYTISGLVGSDTATAISIDISRANGDTADKYTITISGSADNYNITFTNGVYTILTPDVEVTAPEETDSNEVVGSVSSSSGIDPYAEVVLEKTETESFYDVVFDGSSVFGTYNVALYVDGIVVESTDTFTVKMAIPEDIASAETYTIVMNSSEGQQIITAVVQDGYIVFETNELGEFALLENDTDNMVWLIILLAILNLVAAAYLVLYYSKKRKSVKTLSIALPTLLCIVSPVSVAFIWILSITLAGQCGLIGYNFINGKKKNNVLSDDVSEQADIVEEEVAATIEEPNVNKKSKNK